MKDTLNPHGPLLIPTTYSLIKFKIEKDGE